MRPNAWIVLLLSIAGCGGDASSTLTFDQPLRVTVDGPAEGLARDSETLLNIILICNRI